MNELYLHANEEMLTVDIITVHHISDASFNEKTASAMYQCDLVPDLWQDRKNLYVCTAIPFSNDVN